MSPRYARVHGHPQSQVPAYLPANYWVAGYGRDERGIYTVIAGVDRAGWTLDGYVAPRLASGLFGCEEVRMDEQSDEELAQREREGRNLERGQVEREPE